MLPDKHNHDGTPEGGQQIRPRDLLGIVRYLTDFLNAFLPPYLEAYLPPYLDEYLDHKEFIPAGNFEETNANVAHEQLGNFSVLTFTDGVTGIATVSFRVPKYMTNISSIKLIVENANNVSNLYLAFGLTRGRVDAADVSDSAASAVYATGATNNTLTEITVPASAYNALLAIAEGDVLGLKITRTAGDALDTFDADMQLYGVVVEFSSS